MPPAETGTDRAPAAGLVLAAGSSTRMGTNKLLLEIDGEPLVRRAVRQALAAGLAPVLVVVGHEAELARQALRGLECQTVFNPDHLKGVRTSLVEGVSALPPDTPAVVVMLADMPFVTADMIRTLLERFRAESPPLVASRYGDVNAPPVLYGRSLFPELSEREGEGCGKHVVKRHRAEASFVDWPESALADVDLPADYERLKTVVPR